MTNREQAIRRVTEAGEIDTREVRDALNWMDDETEMLIAYAVDTTEKLLAAEARVLELEAEREEQLSILTSVGPITCRNGKQHEHYDGCVYCRIEALEAALKEIADMASAVWPDMDEDAMGRSTMRLIARNARAALQPKGE